MKPEEKKLFLKCVGIFALAVVGVIAVACLFEAFFDALMYGIFFAVFISMVLF